MEPEEVAEAFETLEKAGKVKYFGVSNQNSMQMELLNQSCGGRILIDQLQLSIAHCDIMDSGINVNIHNEAGANRDGSVLEYCRLKGITIQAWSPFQYGMFEGVFIGSEKYPELNRVMERMAEKYNVTPNAIAIAWILRHPAHIQAIVGTTNRQRLKDICKASDVCLTREVWYELYLAAGKLLPALLGLVGGDAGRELEVLVKVTDEDIAKAKELLEKGFCTCFLEEGVEKLYIRVNLTGHTHEAEVVIADKHTRIVHIEKDKKVLFHLDTEEKEQGVHADKSLLNIRDILDFAQQVKLEDIRYIIGRQIEMNTAISEEGLKNHYGAEVGRTLLKNYGNDVKVRARARAAAGSDARMNGCSLPVIINSGSGNQGMTCSLPVIEFAKEWKIPEEKMYRALVVSNLTAIHQKNI